MQFGVSTSCFFPLETERALVRLGTIGVKRVELFLNTLCETEPQFMRELKEICAVNEMQIVAFHPFTSGMETLYFASNYPRRVSDGIKLYRKLFQCAKELGASVFTMHGDMKTNPVDFGYYCENFARLSEIAKEYDLVLCQENVVRCKAGSIDNIQRMRSLLGDEVHFTLDVKQALRSGEDIFDMIDAMAGRIYHVHVSDHTPQQDCLPPGAGELDFTRFFRRLTSAGFDGDMIVELYRKNFESDARLSESIDFLSRYI
ncbi:MAG: sugar phosphate isomerase/epimerase [Pygmaiobacter sp.]